VEPVRVPGRRNFEPDIDPLGGFRQDRRFVIPPGAQGNLIVQHVTTQFDVRQAPGGPAMTPGQIDALVAGGAGAAHATHGSYFELFDPAGHMEDSFSMTSMMSPHHANPADLRGTTSGTITKRGDAHLYHVPPGQRAAFEAEFGFAQPHGAGPHDKTPAGGLPERPAADTAPGAKYPNLTLAQIGAHLNQQPSGQVVHEVQSEWDSFGNRQPRTTLRLNQKPWADRRKKKGFGRR